MKNLLIILILFILKLNATELDELYNQAKHNNTVNDWGTVISNSIKHNDTKYLEEAKTTLWNLMEKKDPLGLKALRMFGVSSKDDLPKFVMGMEKDKKDVQKIQKKTRKQRIKNKATLGKTLQVGVLNITPKDIEIKTFTYIDTVSHQKTTLKKLCIYFEIENTSTTDTVAPVDSLLTNSKIRNEYRTAYYDDTVFLISRGIKDFKYKMKLLPQQKFMTYIPFGYGKLLEGENFSAEVEFAVNAVDSRKKREKIYFAFKRSDIK